jgi:hypothetical protein
MRALFSKIRRQRPDNKFILNQEAYTDAFRVAESMGADLGPREVRNDGLNPEAIRDISNSLRDGENRFGELR